MGGAAAVDDNAEVAPPATSDAPQQGAEGQTAPPVAPVVNATPNAQPTAADTSAPTLQTRDQAPAQTTQAAAPQPPKRGGVGHAILRAISDALGGPETTSSVDPVTGKTTTTARSTESRVLSGISTIGGALAAGAGERGPGHVGKAAAAGSKFVTDQAQRNFENQEKQKLDQAQIYRNHMENLRLGHQIEDEDEASKMKYVQMEAGMDQSYRDAGLTQLTGNAPNGVNDQGLQALVKQYTDGGGKLSNLNVVRVGVAPKVGPDGQPLKDANGDPQSPGFMYRVYEDGPVKLSQQDAEDFSKLPGHPANIAAGQEIRGSQYQQLSHIRASIHQGSTAIDGMLKQNGLTGGQVEESPQAAMQYEEFSRALASSKDDPMAAIGKMKGPVDEVVKRFGGYENLEHISNLKQTQEAVMKEAAVENAKKTVDEPFERRRETFQANIHAADRQAMAQLQMQTKNNDEAITQTQAALKPYTEKLTEVDQLKSALDQARNGNSAAASAVLLKMIGITNPEGTKRFNEAESDRIAHMGNSAQQLYGKLLKVGTGNQWTPDMMDDMNNFANSQAKIAEDGFRGHVKVINALHGTQIDPDSLVKIYGDAGTRTNEGVHGSFNPNQLPDAP